MRKARNTAEAGAVGKIRMARAHPRETPVVQGELPEGGSHRCFILSYFFPFFFSATCMFAEKLASSKAAAPCPELS